MNPLNKLIGVVSSPMFLIAALALSTVMFSPGCDTIEEGIDNIDSRVKCADYCSKRFNCEDYTATDSETATCIADCRDSMEDKCGNDNQAAANDTLGACVDLGCTEFWTCLVFEAAPECFGFVGE